GTSGGRRLGAWRWGVRSAHPLPLKHLTACFTGASCARHGDLKVTATDRWRPDWRRLGVARGAAAGGPLAGLWRGPGRAAVEEDGDRLGGTVDHRDVDAPVVIEVGRHDRMGVAADGEVDAAAELSVSGPRQDLDMAAGFVGIDQVDLPIAVEVLGERRPRRSAQLVRRRGVELVAVAKQDGHRLVELAADDEVLMTVAIGIADDQEARSRRDREGRDVGKLPAPVAVEDGDRTGERIDDRQVGPGVATEAADADGRRAGSHRHQARRREAAPPVTLQDGDGVAAEVDHRQVGNAVLIEIARHQRAWLPSDRDYRGRAK